MRAHVLVCRGPDCRSRGAQDVYTAMATALHEGGFADEEVAQSQSGCVGPVCGSGPVVCCYPSGAWYAGVAPEDVGEIVSEDVGRGRIVERLAARQVKGAE